MENSFRTARVGRASRSMLPTRRVVLLGASNLTRSFATVVETARRTWSEPLEIMCAMGHGRSYGQDSKVLGRKISGIFPSALWQEMERRPPMPTSALVTDIGNDLLYEVKVDQLLEWVEGCLDRLQAVGANTIITELPMGSVARLSEARFQFFRRALFPRSRLTLEAAKALAAETNNRLLAFGNRKKTSVIPASDAWYGFDPIHLRRRVWREAWPQLLSSWRDETSPHCVPRTSLWDRAYLMSLAPHERSVLGVCRHCAQPSGRLRDGTTISLY